MDNMTIFDMLYPTFKISKPIRLIELFAGVGSQAMALRDLGADFKHYKIAEWEVSAFKSYKAIHMSDDNTDYSQEINIHGLPQILFDYGISVDGKEPMTLKQIERKSESWQRETYNNIKVTNNLCSVCNFKGEDLAITDTDKYCYILTYSFPCQDLSVAGKMQGMAKGSNTRSGLLWEVERLLGEVEELPQVLLMENVPQVISDANISDFHKWQDFLTYKGYTNYVEILNAKDFGVAQNRERAFMVSVLGQWNYKFPQTIPLTKTMADYLEDEVDEKYYINSEKAQKLIQQLMNDGQLGGCIGNINPSENGMNGNVFSSNGLAPTLTTNKGEGPKICTDLSINNPRVTDISNCITARQDRGISNHQGVGGAVVEQVKQIGNYEIDSTWDNPQTGRVYSADGISPTLNTCNGGDRQPKIIEVGRINNARHSSLANSVLNTKGICTTIDAMGGGNREPKILEPNSEGLCNTLTSVQKDNLVLEPKLVGGLGEKDWGSQWRQGNRVYDSNAVAMALHAQPVGNTGGNSCLYLMDETVKIKQATQQGYAECKLGGVADLSYPTSKTRRGRVQDNGDTCPTLTATETGVCRIETPYRIRKLTPLECWKLMSFSESDFRKAEKVNSNTQLYKQAGNSIVKAVLMAIFKQIL